MTPEQIKTLIDQKIAGQGTMVDVGGALPTILKEIVDAIAANTEAIADIPATVIEIAPLEGFNGKTEEEVAEMWGITPAQFRLIYTTPGISLSTNGGRRSYSAYFIVDDLMNSHEIMLVGAAPNGTVDGRWILTSDGESNLWYLSEM